MTDVGTQIEQGALEKKAEVKVWDIAVRVFHWSLVAAFALAWLTADEWDKAHEFIGYGIGGLVLFRLFWGVIGSKYARFENFVSSPATIYTYLKDVVYFRAKRYIGHNPAGGAMILLLLFSLITVVATGHMMTMNAFWGSEWVEDVHETFASLTLTFVVFHVAGVLYSSLSHSENLVKSMFNGFKRSN